MHSVQADEVYSITWKSALKMSLLWGRKMWTVVTEEERKLLKKYKLRNYVVITGPRTLNGIWKENRSAKVGRTCKKVFKIEMIMTRIFLKRRLLDSCSCYKFRENAAIKKTHLNGKIKEDIHMEPTEKYQEGLGEKVMKLKWIKRVCRLYVWKLEKPMQIYSDRRETTEVIHLGCLPGHGKSIQQW